MTYDEFRTDSSVVLDAVVDDRDEVVITRPGREPVVILSFEDYESLRETAYLLYNPENASRLLGAIDRLESGEGTVRDLIR
jgi:antitoxin YefM